MNPVLGFRPRPETSAKLKHLASLTGQRKGLILEQLILAAVIGPDGAVCLPVPEQGNAPQETLQGVNHLTAVCGGSTQKGQLHDSTNPS